MSLVAEDFIQSLRVQILVALRFMVVIDKFYAPSRRTFLELSAAVAATTSAKLTHATYGSGYITVSTDNSALVGTAPVQYALGVLRGAVASASRC